MPASNFPTRSQVYNRLKKGFNQFSDMMNVHLENTLLCEMGIDSMQIDLEEETERGGPYFLPMSQERMDSLNKRPEFDITFDDEWSNSVWNFCDGDIINLEFRDQLTCSNDESSWQAYEASHWRPRWYKTTYEMRLMEHRSPGIESNPKCQFDWRIEKHFVAEGFPHRSYIARAGVPDVQGLLRNEMMIITGMMISAMREKTNQHIVVFPLVLVSIIGRYARVVQAHVSLEEQRLKVRYSQLCDFENCSQRQMDLFLRWILSSPLLEPKLQPEADEKSSRARGDTAPQETVFKVHGEGYKSGDPSILIEALNLAE